MLRAWRTALLVLLPAAAAQERAAPLPEGAPAAMARIDRADLLAHAAHLASDELGGRFTGAAGQRAAAEYVAEHFERLGLRPLGDRGRGRRRGWYQRYAISRVFLDPRRTRLTIGGESIASGFAVVPGRSGDAVRVSGMFVFEGAEPEADGGLRGRVPVVLARVPDPGGGAARRYSTGQVALRRLLPLVGRLASRGARAVVFCVLDDDGPLAAALGRAALTPGKGRVSLRHRQARTGGFAAKVPAVFLSAAPSRRLLEAFGLDDRDVRAVLAGEERAAERKAKRHRGRVELAVVEDDEAWAVNVVGVLRGADRRRAREAVVFSAHMDHLGTRFDGEVYNGADDNASGTAGLLEIAEAFAAARPGPERSIVFLSVSGEELGLWGSRHWADEPTWDLDRVVADVNTDMIGRSGPESGPDQVTVTPSHRHERYSTMVRDAARLAGLLGLRLTSGDKYYLRSDHVAFAREGIPVVFFCNGEHEDYHRVTDEADKLDGAKMERIARLAFWTGWRVAAAPGRPQRLGPRDGW